MTAAVQVELANEEATTALGHALAARLFAGAVLGLIGGLGAGKTHLTRAIAHGLGIPHGVSSPTFVLMQEYHGNLCIYHFDAYRLPHPQAFADLGAAEFLEGDGVCIVEWADLVREQLPDDRLEISLQPIHETARRATLLATGPRHAALLETLPLPS
jgi:tRNA threonylcarbamoyladenosine biosynthesis protein TsaE